MTGKEWTISAGWIVAVVVCIAILANALNNSNDLSGIGECVESNAYLEGFQGTSKEKWDVFAEYCKLNK